MSRPIEARELRAGDYIKTPEGIAYLHRVPLNKKEAFTASYMAKDITGEAEFQPDEVIQVFARWPLVLGHR